MLNWIVWNRTVWSSVCKQMTGVSDTLQYLEPYNFDLY